MYTYEQSLTENEIFVFKSIIGKHLRTIKSNYCSKVFGNDELLLGHEIDFLVAAPNASSYVTIRTGFIDTYPLSEHGTIIDLKLQQSSKDFYVRSKDGFYMEFRKTFEIYKVELYGNVMSGLMSDLCPGDEETDSIHVSVQAIELMVLHNKKNESPLIIKFSPEGNYMFIDGSWNGQPNEILKYYVSINDFSKNMKLRYSFE